MKHLGRTVVSCLIGAAAALVVVAVAWGGHELPVYPSFYPHEIEIADVAPAAAANLLRDSKIQAYIGGTIADPPPEPVRVIESLGAFVLVRVKPGPDACAVADRAVASVAARGTPGVIVHPFPVTPFHGDYLHYADLADRADAARIRVGHAANTADVDADVTMVDAAGLVDAGAESINGWIGPPWLRAGWYQADRLLGDAVTGLTVAPDLEFLRERLTTGDYSDAAERINLERDFVSTLAANCRLRVVGYTVKREFFSAEYAAGIENVGYDSLEGLDTPMFLRTVKLKDFPWNGWLALGVNGAPGAAWNPIAGMTDRFGRLLWSALSDPAVLPAPGDAGWVLNRIADVRVNQ
jgi:hypothetical protein